MILNIFSPFISPGLCDLGYKTGHARELLLSENQIPIRNHLRHGDILGIIQIDCKHLPSLQSSFNVPIFNSQVFVGYHFSSRILS